MTYCHISAQCSAHAIAMGELQASDEVREARIIRQYARVMHTDGEYIILAAGESLGPSVLHIMQAYMMGDECELGRILRRHIDAARFEIAEEWAEKRMEQLEKGE